MGLALKSGFAITALFALVYAIVFAIGIWYEWSWWLYIVITLGIVFLQYLISPLIVSWIYRIDWIPKEELHKYFPHLAEVIDKVVDTKGIKYPRVGIIHDLNPNAFTFGWTKNTARIVFTEGISEYCNKREQQAVIAHECGHVIHNDFILMTVVFAIPLVMLTIARWAYWTARFSSFNRRGSDSSESGYLVIALYVIAVFSYVGYWVGYLISLFVSRIREYYADEYAAEVLEDPNPLATGLVKIAYGLLLNLDNEERAKSKVRGAKSLGIFDPSAARNFSQTSMGPSKKYSKEAIQAAAAWDLYNPWARYYQTFSTHPLPAKRIMALNDQCALYECKAEIDLSKAKQIKKKQAGKSMLDEFLVDLTIKLLPSLLFTLLLIFTIFYVLGVVFTGLSIVSPLTMLAGITLNQMLLIWGIGFFIIGFGHITKTKFMYRSNYQPETVIDLVTNVKVSPIRCVPAVLDGYIVGRGVPGYYFSEDLFLQDKTGLMYIDYRSGFRLVDFIFSLWGAKKLQDRHVKVQGWYRRGPGPYLQVDRIIDETGKVRKNYAKAVTYIWAVLSFLVGALLVYLWYAGFLI